MVSDVAISGLTVEYEVISAGFSKDKILKTVNEVSAVTEEGFLADALVVKELNANIPVFILDGSTLTITLPVQDSKEVG